MKCLWLSFLSLFLCNVLLAQHENYIRIVPQYGFVIPHRPSMGVLLQGHVRGMELDLVRHTNGSKAWQRLYRCPDYGIQLFIADLGNPSMLGQGYAVVPFIAFPILTMPHVRFSFNIGSGIGYISHIFDVRDNYKNVAIGSHVNGVMQAAFEGHWDLSQNTALHGRFAFTHFSNAAFKVPNLGINIPTLGVGVSHAFGPSYSKLAAVTPDTLSPLLPKWALRIFVAGGLKEVVRYGGRKYPVGVLQAACMRGLGKKSSLGLGLDGFYNSSLPMILSDSLGNKGPAADGFRLGVVLPYEVHVSQFVIALQVGYYLINAYPAQGTYYQRIGWRYKLNSHIALSYSLKLHLAKADNMEIGVVYSL